MKAIKKLLPALTFLLIIIFSGIIEKENVYAYSYTNIYLEVGESYKQTVKTSKPVFDAYGDTDKQKVTAEWNSSDLSKRTYFTVKAKKYGTSTFYVCSGGKSDEAHRVRTVKVHVYDKASSNKLTVTNSTSKTNNSYANVSVYLWNGNLSTLTLSQTYPFPTSVSDDTSGKAKAKSVTYSSSNTKAATVDSTGKITGKAKGSSTITVKSSWTSSAGSTKTISRNINVYCYAKPVLSIYEKNTPIGKLQLLLGTEKELNYSLANMESTNTIRSASCVPQDSNKLSIKSSNGNFILIPKTVTNGVSVNAIFSVVLNCPIYDHNDSGAATFTKTIPVSISYMNTVTISSCKSSKDGLLISYSENKNASSYDIYRSENEKGDYKYIGNTVLNSYVDTEVKYGKKYYYKVKALGKDNDKFTSEFSNAVSGTKIVEKPVITDIRKINGRYEIFITGTSYNGYNIYLGDNKNVIGSTFSKTATISLSSGYNKIYARAYVVEDNKKIYSAYSDAYVLNVKAAAKVKKPKIAKVTEGRHSLKIKLKAAKGVKGYKVKILSRKHKTIAIKTSKKKTVTIKKLKPKRIYYVKVKAYKIVKGKKVYSKYCKLKKVKTKK